MRDIYYNIDKITEFDLVDIYKKLFEKLQIFSAGSNTKHDDKLINEIKSYTIG